MSKDAYRGKKGTVKDVNTHSADTLAPVESKKTLEELKTEAKALLGQIEKLEAEEKARKEAEEKAAAEACAEEKARKEAEEKAAAKARAEEKARKEAEEKAAAKARAEEKARKAAEEKAAAERKRAQLRESARIENRYPIHKEDGSLDMENPFSSALIAKNFDFRYAVVPYLVIRDVAIRPASREEANKYRPLLTEDDIATASKL